LKLIPKKILVSHEKSEREVESEAEQIIIARCQSDPEAFRPIYEKYFKRIFLFVLHRVADKALASDLTSQVFLKALTHLKTYKFRGLPLSAWLFRIALNECNDYFRKNSRYRIVTIEDENVEHLFEELTEDSRLEDLRARLPSILQMLTEEELQIIEMRFFEQRPFKEVADIVGISENYAKVKVYRILEKMKKLFLRRK
jgi:RNA polymerase sigma-70 factor, ECF subfamily